MTRTPNTPSMFVAQPRRQTKKRRSHVTALIWFALSGLLTQAHCQSSSTSIDPPKGYVVILQARGEGSQVYGCVDRNWILHAPDAKLFDAQGKVIGKHYAGPSWQLTNGSLVQGKPVAKTASSETDSVAWLLLEAAPGTGDFAPVKFIQRRDTHGGMAPITRCSDKAELSVPYTATYLFYAAQP
jgi:hypothetical protein